MQGLKESIAKWFDQLINFSPRLGIGVGVFLLTLGLSNWVAKGVRRSMKRRKVDDEITLLLELLSKWGIRVLGIVIALEVIAPGKFGALIAGLGVLGFTIGFALQDIAKNFVAGILLLLQQPFDIGDAIEVSGFGGEVLGISLRTTEMRTWDGRHVIIPNGDVYTNPIINYSKATRRRLEITAGIASDSDLDRVTRVALDAIKAIPGVLEDPTPQVVFKNFADYSIEFTMYYWIDTKQMGFLAAQDAGIKRIKEVFEREGIEMPYPTQVVLAAERDH
jgi:small conductance mechanosensitive channel